MNIWLILLAIIYLAILTVLVSPNSPAAGAVENISDALSSLVATATGNT